MNARIDPCNSPMSWSMHFVSQSWLTLGRIRSSLRLGAGTSINPRCARKSHLGHQGRRTCEVRSIFAEAGGVKEDVERIQGETTATKGWETFVEWLDQMMDDFQDIIFCKKLSDRFWWKRGCSNGYDRQWGANASLEVWRPHLTRRCKSSTPASPIIMRLSCTEMTP